MSFKLQVSLCIVLFLAGVLSSFDAVQDGAFYYKDYYFSNHLITIDNITIQSNREWVLKEEPSKAGLKYVLIRKSGLNDIDDFISLFIDETGKLINDRLLLLDSFGINNERYNSYEIAPLPKSNPERYIISAFTSPIVLMIDDVEKGKSFLRDSTVLIDPEIKRGHGINGVSD